jgi:Fur family transcriptional regulator, ferric uptake regulator
MPQEHQSKITRLNRGCNQVLRGLKELGKLSTANEIYLHLKADGDQDGPGLTTIYRAIDTLLKLNLVQSVDLGGGERLFETVESGEHHHHLTCTRCKRSVHLEQCLIDSMKIKIEERHGFSMRSHILEMFGLCADCTNFENGS